MKDFDGARKERAERREQELGDRTFTLGGETFSFRANVRYDVLRRVASLTGDTAGDQIIDVLEGCVLDLIEDTDGAHTRFHAVVANADDPVTFQDLNELSTWLVEQQVGRPTQAPSPSTPGRETTGTSSTDISSSAQAEASTA